ncbi:MAG TPA: hypothetical protein VGF55_17400 [Gemmataceae bacterium]|jgi:uncharacterized iron-regulated membrane protein
MIASGPKLDGGEVIGLVAVSGLVLCGVLGILLGFYAHWSRHRRAELGAALRQELLDRGMSADEIVAVLLAGAPDAAGPPLPPPWGVTPAG